MLSCRTLAEKKLIVYKDLIPVLLYLCFSLIVLASVGQVCVYMATELVYQTFWVIISTHPNTRPPKAVSFLNPEMALPAIRVGSKEIHAYSKFSGETIIIILDLEAKGLNFSRHAREEFK